MSEVDYIYGSPVAAVVFFLLAWAFIGSIPWFIGPKVNRWTTDQRFKTFLLIIVGIVVMEEADRILELRITDSNLRLLVWTIGIFSAFVLWIINKGDLPLPSRTYPHDSPS